MQPRRTASTIDGCLHANASDDALAPSRLPSASSGTERMDVRSFRQISAVGGAFRTLRLGPGHVFWGHNTHRRRRIPIRRDGSIRPGSVPSTRTKRLFLLLRARARHFHSLHLASPLRFTTIHNRRAISPSLHNDSQPTCHLSFASQRFTTGGSGTAAARCASAEQGVSVLQVDRVSWEERGEAEGGVTRPTGV